MLCYLCMCWGREIVFQIILDAVHFILAKYGCAAMHGGSVHAYLMGMFFRNVFDVDRNVKFEVGKFDNSNV